MMAATLYKQYTRKEGASLWDATYRFQRVETVKMMEWHFTIVTLMACIDGMT